MTSPAPRNSTATRCRVVLLLLVAALAAATAWIVWGCLKREDVSFLSRRGPAEWIVFPVPPDPEPITCARITTVFRRNFQLLATPAQATLRLRAFKTCAVTLNGQQLPVPAPVNWKTLVTLDAARYLRAGDNTLAVSVTNASGPPALWIELAADGFALLSDGTWEASCAGSIWRPAWPARRPVPAGRGNPLAGAETVPATIRRCWPRLAVSAALCAGIVFLSRRKARPGASRHCPHSGAAVPAVTAGVSPANTDAGGTPAESGETPAPLPDAGETPAPLPSSEVPPAFDPAPWALAGVIALWLVLFIHNFGLLPRVIGFDAAEHLRYIDYVQQHKALPLASEGFEMHQPPLYYLVSAAALGALGLTTVDNTGVLFLRVFSLLIGIAQLLVLFASLRLMFPERPGAQIAGVLLAGLLPTHLILAHYTTNETLSALFVTVTLYCVLRLLNQEAMSLRWLTAAGVALGAALLTKITALLAAPFVFGAIAWRLASRRQRAPSAWLRAQLEIAPTANSGSPSPPSEGGERGGEEGRCLPESPLSPALSPLLRRGEREQSRAAPSRGVWLRALGVPLAATLLVCGWHYARVWTRIGHPLAGHRDFGYGTAWWQQDGFRTADFYKRFGDAFENPFFSGTRSFAGGLYSTMWGDGLWSGAASAGFRAPWNHDLMAAGYALALVPTALLLIGLAAALRRFVREPTAAWFCALGILGATAFALVWMSLKAPTYALVKSFYGLVALAPLGALGAAGWNWIAERGRVARLVAGVAAGIWAATSFGSLWIRGDAPFTQVRLGEGLANDGRGAAAVERFTAALELDPKNVHARSSLAATLAGLGQVDEAARLVAQNVREHPDDPICHLDLASVAESRGDLPSAVEHTRRAILLGPERPRAHRLLAARLGRLGRLAESIEACREGLRLKPADPDLHLLLAAGLAADRGATSAVSALEAATHFRLVLELARESSAALTGLAWLLATHPAAEARQGVEAVALAERAVRITNGRDAPALRALAAAYAETGRFEPAADAVRQAMDLSRAARDESGAKLAGDLLTSIEARRPFRDERGRL